MVGASAAILVTVAILHGGEIFLDDLEDLCGAFGDTGAAGGAQVFVDDRQSVLHVDRSLWARLHADFALDAPRLAGRHDLGLDGVSVGA